MRANGIAMAAVLVLLLAAAPAHAATGLIGHWSLDEGSGSVAADDAGLNQTGALEGAASWIAGKRGGALGFDGLTGRVHVQSTTALEPATVTAAAWVRATGSPGTFRYIVAKGASFCNAASYALYTGPDGGLEFYVSGPGGSTFTRSPDAGTRVWDGAWHLVAGTFDGGVVRLFVDGTEVGSGSPRSDAIDYGVLSSPDLYIGHYAGCDGLDFPGAVDEPRIFNRALSVSEIQALAAYPFRGFLAPVDNEPALNVTKAGSAIPVKFSLGGNRGLGILTAGSPSSQVIACDTSAPADDVETTVTSGASGLQYDPVTDVYTYVWKTDKAWASSCRRLSLRLDDGTVHTASFQFKK
jgi:Concanavalin A-like lectin/glucanases superfamily